MQEYHTCTLNDLEFFTNKVFKSIGCSEQDSKLATEVLVTADLRGIDSHGVARLSGYIRLFESGRINPKPSIKIIKQKSASFTIDGDSGLGLVIAPKAMEIAIEKASVSGLAFAAVCNSNHFGIAAYHAMLALKHDFIGMAMTNASPLVAPTFSKERMLGTNPICYAVPAGKEKPFVLDMATSAAANGKLEIAERKNSDVPEGWLENKEGNKTTKPSDLKAGGYLLPLGSDISHGSHKGYGLGSIVDILSGVLPGANYGPWVPPFVSFLPVLDDLPGKGLGHFLGAMDIDGFTEIDKFKERMDQWISRFRSAGRVNDDQEIIIHGEPEAALHVERLINGIPINNKVINDLIELASRYKIEHPFIK